MVRLALDSPPSPHGRRSRGIGRRVLYGVVLVAVLGAGFALGRMTAPGPKAGKAAGPELAAAPASPESQAATPAPAPAATPSGAPAPGAAATPTAAPTAPPPAPTGPRRLVARVDGPLEDAIAAAMAPSDKALAEQLTQVVNRLLVWQLQVAHDGRRGDRIEVLWSPPGVVGDGVPAQTEPVVDAVRYTSAKLGGVVAAYRWQP